MDETIGINEAAYRTNATRQSVYLAIKKGNLEATKDKRWKITLNALEQYKKERWSRIKSKHNGQPLVSPEKGEFLARQVAENLNIPIQRIYYDMRCNRLKYTRKGAAYIITLADMLEYQAKYLKDAA